MKKQLIHALILSLMFFSTSGWSSLLTSAYCDPIMSQQENTDDAGMMKAMAMNADSDTVKCPTTKASKAQQCCCGEDCQNIDCGIGSIGAGVFIAMTPQLLNFEHRTIHTDTLSVSRVAHQQSLIRPPKRA